jgi:phosphoribosylformylglycinamidine synthase
MTRRVGIVVFPGSNCDRDCGDAVREAMDAEPVYIWHHDTCLDGLDALLLPGGFSYGDYLRCGAIARFSPVMSAVREFADAGRPVLGICNGFQILTEAGLLPGALIRNASMAFQCQHVALTVASTRTPWTQGYRAEQVIQLPIAHAEGQFVAAPDVLADLERNGQVVFRYVDDINGAMNRIAGVSNAAGNVLGMMPHPERALQEASVCGAAGRPMFTALLRAVL